MTVVSGAPTYVKTTWYADAFEQGLAGNYDALGIHPYMGLADKNPEFCDTNPSNIIYYPCNIPNLHQLMKDNGNGDNGLGH